MAYVHGKHHDLEITKMNVFLKIINTLNSVYSSPPLSIGDMVQDPLPQWMPETG